MDLENNELVVLTERQLKRANFQKKIYKYAGATSFIMILFEFYRIAESYEIIMTSNALITFQIIRILLKISVLPLNYVFELEPILQQRKGNIIDTSDKFLGSRSMMKNFIIEGTIEWRALIYVLVGLFCVMSQTYSAFANFGPAPKFGHFWRILKISKNDRIEVVGPELSNALYMAVLSGKKMNETDPGSIALMIAGFSFMKLRWQYPSEFEKIYE